MSSVGHSFAVLRGRRTGNKDKAAEFLGGLSPSVLQARNRQEAVSRNLKAKKPYRLGESLNIQQFRKGPK